MGRFALCASLFLGCGNALPQPGPEKLLAEGALLAGVAPDDSLIAIVVSQSAANTRDLSVSGDGVLQVVPPSLAGPPVTVDQGVAGVFGFAPGGYLVYGVKPPDGDLLLPMVWKAGWAQPIALSSDPIESASFSESDILYTGTGSQTGTLSTVRLSDCDSGSCALLALGTASGFWPSADGARCVFQNLTPAGADLFFFDHAQAAPALVAHVDAVDLPQAGVRLIDLARDGSPRLAHLAPGGAVQVRSLPDLALMPWTSLPEGASLSGIIFASGDNLLLEVKAQEGGFLYQSSSAEMRQIAAADHFEAVLDDNHQVVTAFLLPDEFASPSPALYAVTAVDFATGDIVPIATQTNSEPRTSSDGTAAFFFDQVDVQNGWGSLEIVDIPSLFSPSGPDSLTLAVSAPTSARFAPHSTQLVYYDYQFTDTIFTVGPGIAPKQVASGAGLFKLTASRTMYWQSNTPPSATSTAGLKIFAQPL